MFLSLLVVVVLNVARLRILRVASKELRSVNDSIELGRELLLYLAKV